MTTWNPDSPSNPSWGAQSLSIAIEDYLSASPGVYLTDRLGNKFILNHPTTLQGTSGWLLLTVTQQNWQ